MWVCCLLLLLAFHGSVPRRSSGAFEFELELKLLHGTNQARDARLLSLDHPLILAGLRMEDLLCLPHVELRTLSECGSRGLHLHRMRWQTRRLPAKLGVQVLAFIRAAVTRALVHGAEGEAANLLDNQMRASTTATFQRANLRGLPLGRFNTCYTLHCTNINIFLPPPWACYSFLPPPWACYNCIGSS